MRAAGRLLLIVLLCAAVYLPMLGRGGLRATEGHRTIPAIELSDRHAWLVPTMFDTVYLRKPPGVFWAIRLSTDALGRSEFAARLVSAVSVGAGAVAAGAFGMRWFGVRDGWWAGVAYALLPVVFEGGRAAEIEAMNNLGALIAAALIIELIVRRRGRATSRALLGGVAVGAAVLLTLIAKGPAAGTVLVGAIAAAVIVRGSVAALFAPGVWLGVVLACAAAAGLAVTLAGELASWPEPHVLQSPAAFSFEPGRALQILTLVPAAFAAHLPASLAMLIVLWPGGSGNRASDAEAFDLSRAAALAWVIAVVLLMLVGTSNPRYAQPAVGLACLCVPWAVRTTRGAFGRRRELAARWSLLGGPVLITLLLIAVCAVRIALLEPRQLATSGREPGHRLAGAVLDDGGFDAQGPTVVYADQLIEARPETLFYAQRLAASRGLPLRVHWSAAWDPLEGDGPSLPALAPGQAAYLALRTDTDEFGSSELERFERAGLTHRLLSIHEDRVHKYPFTVFRLMPASWAPADRQPARQPAEDEEGWPADEPDEDGEPDSEG
ncbi:MAG: ArnT family glycosyltransferase [Phycisphaerales bacterium]